MFHIQKFLGKIQFATYIAWESIGFWLGLLGFTGSVVLLFVNPQLTNVVVTLLTASLLLTFIQIIIDIMRMRASVQRYGFKRRGLDVLKRLRMPAQYRGIRRAEYAKGVALYSEELNRTLATVRLKFAKERGELRYSLRKTLDYIFLVILYHWYTEKKKILFNNRKVRLKSDLLDPGLDPLRKVLVQQTNYFSSLCSNEQTMVTINDSRTDFDIFDGFEFAYPGGSMPMLDESRCANQIGISTLAMTTDHKIVLGFQSGQSAQSAECLTCSGSGSADWRDLGHDRGSFTAFLERAMERELMEECGLQSWLDRALHRYDTRQVQTRVIGFARLTERGGKPEFFGISALRVPSSRIRRKGVERYYGQPFSRRDFIDLNGMSHQEIIDILSEKRNPANDTLSTSLYLNLLFLADFITTFPDEFKKLKEYARNR